MQATLERVIIARLDEEWRSVQQVRHLVGFGDAIEVANALERLARLGRIERTERSTGVARRIGRKIGGDRKVRFYRRRTDGSSETTSKTM
jgi:hypothetical protein